MLSFRTSIFLIIGSLLISAIGALPMIINRNDYYLLPALVVSNLLFIVGITGVLKKRYQKQ